MLAWCLASSVSIIVQIWSCLVSSQAYLASSFNYYAYKIMLARCSAVSESYLASSVSIGMSIRSKVWGLNNELHRIIFSMISVHHYLFHHSSTMLSSIWIIPSIICQLWWLSDHASTMLSIIRIMLDVMNINCCAYYINITKLG